MNSENKNGHENKTLQITINHKKYDWTKQYITGAEIRKIANISDEDDIFLKINSPWVDEPIPNDKEVDLARPGIEHFFSKMKLPVIIIVNGREKVWPAETISYNQVVKLAFDNAEENDKTIYTVTYDKGPKQNPEGVMVKGDVVCVKNKMVFNCTATTKS
ncbi:MAG: multiubiquitin domain-containing protein [Bacteroidota bacterium]